MTDPATTSHTDVAAAPADSFVAPHPGDPRMPQWDTGELPAPPVFNPRNMFAFVGPSLVMAAAAIGGGEWLTGPLVTAKYGGSLLWLATFSILFQVVYNIEISRYTLYTGEPIFTGKFRVPPGPLFWLTAYLIIDFGSLLPYLASNAAVPLSAMMLGKIIDPNSKDLIAGWGVTPSVFQKTLGCLIFISICIPLSVGGKVYNSLRTIMTFKLIVVVGFLTFLALMYSTPATWKELTTGFFKVGNVPLVVEQDTNHNGKRDEGEAPHEFRVGNIFLSLWEGKGFPMIDMTMIGLLASMAAISGNGGLTNTPVSNYTREQGWGMGKHVGAIPSIVGGHAIQLSHVGMVFQVTEDSLKRWKGWVRHVSREQWLFWMPACFFGLAFPSMLSVQFLPRGTQPADNWQAASMTANGVADAIRGTFTAFGQAFGTAMGNLFWELTLFCGFLVLATSTATTADGVLRRWVDTFWTASPTLRKWDTTRIGQLYFGVLVTYIGLGLCMLLLLPGDQLLVAAAGILYNYALGISCWHALYVNHWLLPKPLRPGWASSLGLVLGGVFFNFIAILTTIAKYGELVKAAKDLFGG